jgi:hypothetical protein
VASVESFGAELHLFLDPDRATPEQLAEELARRGLGPAEFTKVVPSLEDIFILLIRKASREAA